MDDAHPPIMPSETGWTRRRGPASDSLLPSCRVRRTPVGRCHPETSPHMAVADRGTIERAGDASPVWAIRAPAPWSSYSWQSGQTSRVYVLTSACAGARHPSDQIEITTAHAGPAELPDTKRVQLRYGLAEHCTAVPLSPRHQFCYQSPSMS